MNEATTPQTQDVTHPDVYGINQIPRETYLKEAAKLYPMTTAVAVTSIRDIEEYLINGGALSLKAAILHLMMMFSKKPEKAYEFYGFSNIVLHRMSADPIVATFTEFLAKESPAAVNAAAEINGDLTQFNADAQDLANQFGITELQYQTATYYLIGGIIDAWEKNWDLSDLMKILSVASVRRAMCMALYDMLREENVKMSTFMKETSLGQLYPFVLNEQIARRLAKQNGMSGLVSPDGTPMQSASVE